MAAHTPEGLPLSLQVEDLRAAGREPYAYSFQRTHTAAELQAQFGDLEAGQVGL